MFTLFVWFVVGYGLYRLAKLAAANPGSAAKTASWFKDAFGK